MSELLEKTKTMLLDQRGRDGHWVGELSASALSTATAISVLAFFSKSTSSKRHESLIQQGIQWLISHQNPDGGWGDTVKNYSNISTTMLTIAAFKAADVVAEHNLVIRAAQQYVDAQDGVSGIKKRYGDDKTFAVPILANAAMVGLVPWSEVDPLPFEVACVPQRFFHWFNLPVVSYAIPALVAIGQVKFHFDPPRNPLVRWIRYWARTGSLKLLQKMQPASGGFWRRFR